MISNRPLGRLTPKDFSHVENNRLKDILPTTVDVVNRHLPIPSWHWQWDQGQEGACVGYGESMMKTITELANHKVDRRYDPRWLWTQAKLVDGFTHTDPNDGTTLHAGCQVLIDTGHVQVHPTSHPSTEDSPKITDGISTVRWATTVDEVRSMIALGNPVAIGINWYSDFDSPRVQWLKGSLKAYWIGLSGWDQTQIRGGHCVCIYAAYDKWGGVKIKNSWGKSYPIVYMPYETLDTLLTQDGEAALITDR